MKELSIIMPAWNEEERIERSLGKYIRYFSEKRGYDFEIIVVVDGCTDKTPMIVKEFSEKYSQVRYLNFPDKLGKGGGIIEGFKIATGDIVTFADADGATEAEELDRIVSTVKDCDGVIGSRWLDGARIIVKEPLARIIASRGFNFMVRLLFDLPFKDTQCGAKAFKNYVIRDVVNELGLTNFAFDVDLLYRVTKRGYKVKEIPITWMHNGNSNLKLREVIPTMFLSIIGLRIKNSPIRRFIPKRAVRWLYSRIKSS
jgi:glycosyltransferase involved in cell wall biosynthesis